MRRRYYETNLGGAFAVLDQAVTGKLPDHLPLFNGHAGAVLDTDFHPFNDHIIASASEDCKVLAQTHKGHALEDP